MKLKSNIKKYWLLNSSLVFAIGLLMILPLIEHSYAKTLEVDPVCPGGYRYIEVVNVPGPGGFITFCKACLDGNNQPIYIHFHDCKTFHDEDF